MRKTMVYKSLGTFGHIIWSIAFEKNNDDEFIKMLVAVLSYYLVSEKTSLVKLNYPGDVFDIKKIHLKSFSDILANN
jgi:hypothetical protein